MNAASIITVSLLILCALWVSQVEAGPFMKTEMCRLTEESSILGEMRAEKGSHFSMDFMILKTAVVGIRPLPQSDVFKGNEDYVECSVLRLVTGQTVFVVGTVDEIMQKVLSD